MDIFNNCPAFSVIVPVYNTEKYLKECVDSIRNQTLSNIEIILVDDGSIDGCPAMCDLFAAEDSRIRVLHQINSGVSVARNNGIQMARGEWIMFVDSDDWLELDAIESLYQKNLKCNCDIVVGAYYKNYIGSQVSYACKDLSEQYFFVSKNLIYLAGSILIDIPMSKSLFPKEMWYNPPLFYPVMKLYRRELIQSKGISFPEGVSRCEDRLFNLQVITHANIICYINNKPIYHWRQRESSATRQIGKMYKDYVSFISIIKENYIQAMNMHKLRPYFNLMCMQLSYNIFSVCVQTDIKSCKILKQFRNDGICNKAFQNTPIHMIDSRKRRVGIGIIKYRIYYLAYLMLRLFFILLPRKKSSDLFP